MWMTPQRLLPASPRAVATVSKAACITPAASAALATTQRRTSSIRRFSGLVRLQRKGGCKNLNLHKLSERQLGCCKNLHKTDQGASLLQELELTALEATRLLQELAQN